MTCTYAVIRHFEQGTIDCIGIFNGLAKAIGRAVLDVDALFKDGYEMNELQTNTPPTGFYFTVKDNVEGEKIEYHLVRLEEIEMLEAKDDD